MKERYFFNMDSTYYTIYMYLHRETYLTICIYYQDTLVVPRVPVMERFYCIYVASYPGHSQLFNETRLPLFCVFHWKAASGLYKASIYVHLTINFLAWDFKVMRKLPAVIEIKLTIIIKAMKKVIYLISRASSLRTARYSAPLLEN